MKSSFKTGWNRFNTFLGFISKVNCFDIGHNDFDFIVSMSVTDVQSVQLVTTWSIKQSDAPVNIVSGCPTPLKLASWHNRV